MEGLSDVSALSPCTQLHTLSLNGTTLTLLTPHPSDPTTRPLDCLSPHALSPLATPCSLAVNRLQDLRSLCVVPSVSDLSLKDNSLSSLNGIQALPHLTHLVLDINQVPSF